ncbi:MAG: hypothetical protein KGN80_02390 [Acidobacteriota bacterium]|nr:hypothetical protein [Acidobacteriota bacterium]
MADTLRKLLIQRAARLQERPAFSAPPWGTLDYSQFRNRVEGVALGLVAVGCQLEAPVYSATDTPWDWAAEVAAACCGLRWESTGASIDPGILGGARFNDEEGRGLYHEREHLVDGSTRFSGLFDHAAMLLKLQRMNRILGWDHETRVGLPLAQLGTPAIRAALWCALYAGSHAMLKEESRPPSGLFKRAAAGAVAFDPSPFAEFWGLS